MTVTTALDQRDDAIAQRPYNEADVKARSQRLPTQTLGQAAAVMLVSGSSYEEIAVILDLDSAEQAKRIAIRSMASQFDDDDRDAMRRIVIGMYNQLFVSALRRSEKQSYSAREAAASNARAAVSEMVKVLGLAAPTQIEVYSPTQTEIDSLLKQVAAKAAAAMPVEADVVSSYVVDDG